MPTTHTDKCVCDSEKPGVSKMQTGPMGQTSDYDLYADLTQSLSRHAVVISLKFHEVPGK